MGNETAEQASHLFVWATEAILGLGVRCEVRPWLPGNPSEEIVSLIYSDASTTILPCLELCSRELLPRSR
jgi:hypothetical protein